MRDWLTVELLLGTLLTTTFTCVGLLALWAATSPRRWFVRSAIAFAILSPLLLIPAAGPFLVFLAEILLVAAGVTAYRTVKRSRGAETAIDSSADSTAQPRWQYSVKSGLALCTCVAVLTGVVAKVPEATWNWWQIIGLSAIAGAVGTLLAAWVAKGKSPLLLRIAVVVAYAFSVIGVATFNDKGFAVRYRLIGDALASFFSIMEGQSRLLAVVTIATLIAIVSTLRFANTSGSTLARLIFVTLCLLIAVAPIAALVALLQPLPTIDTTMPTPNGYDDLVRIGQRLDAIAINADVVDTAKLDAAVAQYEPDFVAIASAVKRPFKMPVNYDPAAFDIKGPMALRNIGRVLDAKGDAKLRAKAIDESLACRLQILTLAQSVEHSGLLIQFLVGCAIEETAARGIYRGLNAMDTLQCRETIRSLAEFENKRVDFNDVRAGELVWMVKTQGWPNHLAYLFDKINGHGSMLQAELAMRRKRVLLGLLVTELALRAYRLDHGQLPSKLTALVPDYLAAPPLDSFAPSAQPFCYQQAGDHYKLWSVGYNGVNDGGIAPKQDESGDEISGTGDPRLDVYFKDEMPNEPPPNSSSSLDSGAAAER